MLNVNDLTAAPQLRRIEYSEANLRECCEQAAQALLIENNLARGMKDGIVGLKWQGMNCAVLRRHHVFALLSMSCQFVVGGRQVKPPREIVEILMAGEPRHIFPRWQSEAGRKLEERMISRGLVK